MNKTTVTWIDTGGRERVTVLNSVAGATATLTAIRAVSNATITTIHDGGVTSTGAPLASSDPYCDLDDSWIVTCQDITGDSIELYIPAPLASATDVDGRNANLGSAPWTGLAAFMGGLNHPYTSAPLTSITVAQVARAVPDAFGTWTNMSTAIDWGRRTLQWADIHGNTRLTHILGDISSLGTNFDDIQSALEALSAAVVTHYWEGAMGIVDDPPTTDMYNSVNDECRITLQDGFGNETVVIVPAPNRAIFLPDGKTLDQSNVDIIALISAADTELVVPISGRPVLQCVNGLLGKRSVY